MFNPNSPVFLGPHNVEDWVKGLEVDGERIYKKIWNWIILANPE